MDREARASDVYLSEGRVWTGSAAWRAELAGLPGRNYVFRAADLEDFGSAVTTTDEAEFSSEAALALLLRKVVADARPIGQPAHRVVVSLDDDGFQRNASGLEQFLSEVLSLPVRVVSMTWAFESFLLRRVERAGRAGLLAVLEDQAWVAKMAAGKMKATQVPSHRGLAPLREELEDCGQKRSSIPVWSTQRMWREFVAWHSSLGPALDPAAPAFWPHVIDRRFRRRAVVPLVAHAASRAAFATAVAGALGAMNDLPSGTDLWLVGDDALKLGLRESIEPRRQTTLSLKTQGLARVAMAMAETEVEDSESTETLASYGVLIRNSQGGPKQLHTLVRKGCALPAVGDVSMAGVRGAQRRFKIDVAVQFDNEAPRILRHVYFEHRSPSTVGEIRLNLKVDHTNGVHLHAVEQQTRESLRFVGSTIPAKDGTALAGPELVARLSLVDGAA